MTDPVTDPPASEPPAPPAEPPKADPPAASFDAKEAVEKVRADMEAGFASIAAMLAQKPEPAAVPAEPTGPQPPEPRTTPKGAQPTPDAKPKRKIQWRSGGE